MHLSSRAVRGALVLSVASLLGACSYMPQLSPRLQALGGGTQPEFQEVMAPIKVRSHVLFAVTQDNQLISFNASTPGELISKIRLDGLQAGERLLGIDFRVFRGELFGLSNQGRLMRIHLAAGTVTPVGPPISLPKGENFGIDFNPTVDRVRVVNDQGANLRLHPETGAVIDFDPATPGVQPDKALAYQPGDLLAGNTPTIVAAGYTYDKTDEKITTEYAIDARLNYLVIQGSTGTAKPFISPNTGLLQAVGPLRIDSFDKASFDIADIDNAAYLVTTRQGRRDSRLYEVNLNSGQARLIGAVASDQPIVGIAIEP